MENQFNNINENGYNSYNEETEVMTMGQWLITLLVFMIPCAGIIMMFVWAFSSGGNQNRKNFCRAYLVFNLILLVLYFVLFSVIGASIVSMLSTMY